jgi:hypothetical protein
MRLNGRAVGAVLTLVFIGFVASACGSSAAPAPQSTVATSHTTSGASAGTAPTLTNLTSSVQAQITGTGANDFNVTGLSKLTCDPPAAWKVGATFKCLAYDFAQDEIGEYNATVQSESGGGPQWTGQWIPK